MSEYIAAEITIGGPVPRRLVPALIRTIKEAGVSVGWEEEPFKAATSKELLDLARDAEGRPSALHVVDCQAAWGRFEALEAFLTKHGIAFDRWTEGKYEYDPEVVRYRPGMQAPCVQTTSHDREPALAVSYLEPVTEDLKQGQHRRALQRLRRLLGRSVPELKPLRIVRDQRRSPGRRNRP